MILKKRSLVCIFNPKAGEGRFGLDPDPLGKHIIRTAKKKEINIDLTFKTTTHPGHAKEISTQARKEGVDVVVAVGGDGTISETASGLVGGRTALGIIPAGSGNDILRSIGMPLDCGSAIKDIVGREPTPLDMGRMNQRYFVNVVGIGLDAEVNHDTHKRRALVKVVGPTCSYAVSAFRVLPVFKPKRLLIEIDDAPIDHRTVAMCTIGNGPYCGGGFKLMPLARMNDGLLDMSLCGWRSLFRSLHKFRTVYKGQHLDLPEVTYKTFKKISIKSKSGRLAYHLDGEMGFAKKFDIEVIPKAIGLVHRVRH